MRVVATFVAFWTGAVALSPGATAQAPLPTAHPRLAAVRFALANGWQFPKANLVLAVETHMRMPDGPRPVIRSSQEDAQENQEIAGLLGPGVKTGRRGDYLSCPTPWGGARCRPRTDAYLLVVGGPFEGQPTAGIELHTPPARNGGLEAVTHATVELERRGTDWVGVRYRHHPHTLSRPGGK